MAKWTLKRLIGTVSSGSYFFYRNALEVIFTNPALLPSTPSSPAGPSIITNKSFYHHRQVCSSSPTFTSKLSEMAGSYHAAGRVNWWGFPPTSPQQTKYSILIYMCTPSKPTKRPRDPCHSLRIWGRKKGFW